LLSGRVNFLIGGFCKRPRRQPQMQEFGFSAAFLRIIQALFKAHIPYARFDADAAEVEGLQEFSW
jgi:hypothetical protein